MTYITKCVSIGSKLYEGRVMMVMTYITKCVSIGSKLYEGRVMMVTTDYISHRDRNTRRKNKGGL